MGPKEVSGQWDRKGDYCIHPNIEVGTTNTGFNLDSANSEKDQAWITTHQRKGKLSMGAAILQHKTGRVQVKMWSGDARAPIQCRSSQMSFPRMMNSRKASSFGSALFSPCFKFSYSVILLASVSVGPQVCRWKIIPRNGRLQKRSK